MVFRQVLVEIPLLLQNVYSAKLPAKQNNKHSMAYHYPVLKSEAIHFFRPKFILNSKIGNFSDKSFDDLLQRDLDPKKLGVIGNLMKTHRSSNYIFCTCIAYVSMYIHDTKQTISSRYHLISEKKKKNPRMRI